MRTVKIGVRFWTKAVMCIAIVRLRPCAAFVKLTESRASALEQCSIARRRSVLDKRR
jgi:hypothetical protein